MTLRSSRSRRLAHFACMCLFATHAPSILAGTTSRDGNRVAAVSTEATTARVASGSSSASGSPSTSASTSASSTSSSSSANPTSFPVPFDAPLGPDFVSSQCPSFLSTLQQLPTITRCKPASLLLTSSSGFFQAEQDPLNQLPTLLTQMCNVPSNCTSSMNTLAIAIQRDSNCGQDIARGQKTARSALDGLRNYGMQKDAFCLTDPTTNQFCFVNATASSTTSAALLYFLPTGQSIPSTATLLCGYCTQAVMDVYAPYSSNKTLSISKTYPAAQSALIEQCGSSFSPSTSAPASSAASSLTRHAIAMLSLSSTVVSLVMAFI